MTRRIWSKSLGTEGVCVHTGVEKSGMEKVGYGISLLLRKTEEHSS